MSRLPSLNPPDKLHISIDKDLKRRMEIILWSELEQRIPRGAWQGFVEARIREWLGWRQHPLESLGFPAGYFISGPPEMVQSVVDKLKGEV